MDDNSIVVSSLHQLLAGKRWKDAEALVHSDQSRTFELGSPYNALPLITALMHQPPLWLVDSLIEANPAAVRTINDFGLLPIRVAIRSKCSTGVINALIRENPESVKCFGVSGKTCLHLACVYNCDLELIEKLLEVWPQATEWRDRDGW
jgi:ankyrin repeat protein